VLGAPCSKNLVFTTSAFVFILARQAFFRRAQAYIGMGKVKEAKDDFAKCSKLAPQDKPAKEKLKVSARDTQLLSVIHRLPNAGRPHSRTSLEPP